MTGTWFQTTDVDEANIVSNQVFYESKVEPVRYAPGAFRYRLKYDSAGPMSFATLSHACEIKAKVGGLDMTYSIGVPLQGAFPLQFGHEDVVADPFRAVVCNPTTHVSYNGYQTGTERLFVLSFDENALESHLCSLLGRDRVGTVKFAPSLDLRTGLGAQWWRFASTLALALQSPQGLVGNQLMTAQLSSTIITGLLLAADHPYRDDLDARARAVPPSAIRRASEIIESRAHEPLTIPEIAAEIGCSVRALQLGYRKHLGMTPREHLGRVRMERAHQMLQFASPHSTTVGEIAALWGFRQSGHFAREYGRIYGVLPHVTLRGG